jgi:uncharacterized protein (TIGR00725 family)
VTTRRKAVGVMGPAAAGRAIEDEAFELGRLIAGEGCVLSTGGRACGVMDAASRGARTVAGSVTVGILPGGSGSSDVSDGVDIAIFTAMGDARNAINVQTSDVIVAFGAASPGTCQRRRSPEWTARLAGRLSHAAKRNAHDDASDPAQRAPAGGTGIASRRPLTTRERPVTFACPIRSGHRRGRPSRQWRVWHARSDSHSPADARPGWRPRYS